MTSFAFIIDEAKAALTKCEEAVDAAEYALTSAKIAKDQVQKILAAATLSEDLDKIINEARPESPTSVTSHYYSCYSFDGNSIEEDYTNVQHQQSHHNTDIVDHLGAGAVIGACDMTSDHDVNGNFDNVNPSVDDNLGNSNNMTDPHSSSYADICRKVPEEYYSSTLTFPQFTSTPMMSRCNKCGQKNCVDGKPVTFMDKLFHGKEVDKKIISTIYFR